MPRKPATALVVSKRRREVSLCCFGLGNELVAAFPHSHLSSSSVPSSIHTLSLDRVPANKSWLPIYDSALRILGALRLGDSHASLLEASKAIRGMVEDAALSWMPDPETALAYDGEWQNNLRNLILAWRALEITQLEKCPSATSLRTLLMDFANEALDLDPSNARAFDELSHFEQAEALLMQGRGEDASKLFRSMVVGFSGRMRRYYELISDASAGMPGQGDVPLNSPDDMTRWRESLLLLEGLVSPKTHAREHQLVKMLQGDVKYLVTYVQGENAARWGGHSWIRLLALVVAYHEPFAKKPVLASLSERCAAAVPLSSTLESEGAVRTALSGEAMRAMQQLFNVDSFAEAVMVHLFSLSGALESPSLAPNHLDNDKKSFVLYPEELDVRESSILRFASSLALGPGRVQSRPVECDTHSLRISLGYISRLIYTQGAKDAYLRTLVDRAVLSTDRVVRELLEAIAVLKDSKLSRTISISRLETLLVARRFGDAISWADSSQGVECGAQTRVLQVAVETFLDSESVTDWDDVNLDCAPTRCSIQCDTALRLFRAGKALNRKQFSESAELVAGVIHNVPVASRLAVMKRTLFSGNADALSSKDCLQFLRCMDAPGSKRGVDSSSEMRAILGILFARAVQRESAPQI